MRLIGRRSERRRRHWSEPRPRIDAPTGVAFACVGVVLSVLVYVGIDVIVGWLG